MVALDLVSYYHVHLYLAGVFHFPDLVKTLVLPLDNHPILWVFWPTLDFPRASSTLKHTLALGLLEPHILVSAVQCVYIKQVLLGKP